MKYLIIACGFTLALMAAGGARAAAPAIIEPARRAVPASPIPYKKEEASTGVLAGRSFVVLAVLLGIAFAGLVVMRRRMPQWQAYFPSMGKAGLSRRIKLIETMRLGPRGILYLVQFDGQVILLAQSGDRIVRVDAEAKVADLTGSAGRLER